MKKECETVATIRIRSSIVTRKLNREAKRKGEVFSLPKVLHSSTGVLADDGYSRKGSKSRKNPQEGSYFRNNRDNISSELRTKRNPQSDISRNIMDGIKLQKLSNLKVKLNNSKNSNERIRNEKSGKFNQLFQKRGSYNSSKTYKAKVVPLKPESSPKETVATEFEVPEQILPISKATITSLSAFEILQRLGKGAYAQVHLIKKTTNSKFYALKTYPKSYFTKPHRLQNIRNESAILFSVNHPNIVKLHYVCETPKNIHFLMSKSGDNSLDKYIEIHKKLDEDRSAIIMKGVVSGLYYLHKRGIAHRDIKLGNVLIGEGLHTWLIDFGFAIQCGNDKLTSFCGTPCYMCPEILMKKPYRGMQADIWALGVMLYRMVVGVQPFKGKGKDLRKSIVLGRFVMPNNLSPEFQELINGMLYMVPNRRYTIQEVSHMLISGIEK